MDHRLPPPGLPPTPAARAAGLGLAGLAAGVGWAAVLGVVGLAGGCAGGSAAVRPAPPPAAASPAPSAPSPSDTSASGADAAGDASTTQTSDVVEVVEEAALDPAALAALRSELPPLELRPQTPGVVDLYAIAFAGYELEDVFLQEAELALSRLELEIGAEGRTVLLSSHAGRPPGTRDARPPVLAVTLREVAEVMDPEEDILLVLLTSHGRKDGWLKVRQRSTPGEEGAPVVRADLSPRAFAAMLDDAGPRHRLVVVSACYAGAFIPPLASSTTAVLTAAAADRPSFGCRPGARLTYFGEAFLEQSLQLDRPLDVAFDEASRRIEERERTEGLKPSLPQRSIGPELADRWRRYAEERRQPAGGDG